MNVVAPEGEFSGDPGYAMKEILFRVSDTSTLRAPLSNQTTAVGKGGPERGMRDSVTRRPVWQGFLDWLRASDRATDGAVSAPTLVRSLSAPSEAWTSSGFLSTVERARQEFLDEEGKEIDPDELLDFLAADHDPVPVDPVFRDRLRKDLWALVEKGAVRRPPRH